MKYITPKKIAVCVFAFFLIAAGSWLLIDSPPLAQKNTSSLSLQKTISKLPEPGEDIKSSTVKEEETKTDEIQTSTVEDEFISHIQEKYGDIIFNKWAQIKVTQELIKYLQEFYPDEWELMVQSYLKKMFPALGDQLFDQYLRHADYSTWLSDSKEDLNLLPGEERMDRIWEMRFQIFGEDVFEIWEVALKNKQIYDSIKTISQTEHHTFEEKTETYLNTINEAYGEKTATFMKKRSQELIDLFLNIDLVQEDLNSFTPDARKNELRKLRESFGLDEEALSRWEDLDEERDYEWQKGLVYMQNKSKLSEKYSGEELSEKIENLRNKIFGTELAQVIKSEEEASFERFNKKRKIGME